MSELTKKPEFWISAAALLVSIVGSGYTIKGLSDLKKRVDNIDQVVGTILQKLTPQGTTPLSGLDALIAHDSTNAGKLKAMRKEIDAINQDIGEFRESQTRIFRALEAIVTVLAVDKKAEVIHIQQMLGLHNQPYGPPPGYGPSQGYGQPHQGYGAAPGYGPPPPNYGQQPSRGGRGHEPARGGRGARQQQQDGNESDDPIDRRGN